MGADEDINNPVPVELINFVTTSLNNCVNLYWCTKTEINCLRFDIERKSENENKWELIHSIEGHGNSSNENEYCFTDNYTIFNNTQYRLKQIDIDGEYKYYYSKVLNCVLPSIYMLKQNYPNPFNPSTNINFTLPNAEFVTLKIYDILGREVTTLINEEMNAGNYTKIWDAKNLSSGVYFYKLQAGKFSETKKMILKK